MILPLKYEGEISNQVFIIYYIIKLCCINELPGWFPKQEIFFFAKRQ